jgi:hypothetical protein
MLTEPWPQEDSNDQKESSVRILTVIIRNRFRPPDAGVIETQNGEHQDDQRRRNPETD